jgi:hypothetical protein
MDRDYVNTYLDIVNVYLDTMKKSQFITDHINRDFLIYTGFRTITNIFQINYAYTNDLGTSFYNAQKAYMFYLEYLEQMEKTNMSHDLNYTDAVQFVYSKTVTHLTPIKSSDKYARVSRLTEAILWCGGMRPDISKKTILNCFQADYETILYCLEMAQLRPMDNSEYEEFLSIIIKKRDPIENPELQKIHKLRDLDANLKLPIKQWCKWLLMRCGATGFA